ncbi:MAG: hypothetical protein RSF38_04900 [Erysipelotrichaceae bacterium]
MYSNVFKRLILSVLSLSLLSGCSFFNQEDTKEKEKVEMRDKNKEIANDASNTIDSMIKWMNEKGIQMDEMETLNEMNFAAHEGRSFKVKGNLIYLYRVNTKDEKMKSFLKETKTSSKVKVNENGVEKEYKAMVKDDYLMIYDQGMDNSQLEALFPTYEAMKNAGSNKSNV